MDTIDHIYNDLSNLNGGGSVNAMQSMSAYQEKANFAIQTKRLTANIAEELPYVLFGFAFLASGYSEVINLPSGVTCTVKAGLVQNTTDDAGTYKKVLLTYTSGANVDTVEITSKASSAYPTLLANMASDVFTISKVRQSISPATETSQFATQLAVVNKSIFGKAESNDINLDSYKKPEQFQSGIIDIGLNCSLDKESAFVGSLIAVAGITVTNSFSVSRIKKFNRNVLS